VRGRRIDELLQVVNWVAAGRAWGATGRLIADNQRRSQRRITLTFLTLAVGLTTIVSVTGVMSFLFDTLLDRVTEDAF